MRKAPENLSVSDWDITAGPSEIPARNAGETIDCMHRAAIRARRDPKRRGNVIYLPPKGDVLITGDLHGCRPNFDRLVKFAALERHPNRHLILHELEHGGLTDRDDGCLSWTLVEDAAALKCDFPDQVHILLANHDVAEILNIQLHKGPTNLTRRFWDGLVHAYGDRAAEVKQAYCDFWKSLPLAVRAPNGVWISHSTPHLDALVDFDYGLFDRELADDDFTCDSQLYSFLWGRNQDEMAGAVFAEHVGCDVLIVGHQPSQMGYKAPNARHIILYSDNQLGRFILMPLGEKVSHYALTRAINKIADLPR